MLTFVRSIVNHWQLIVNSLYNSNSLTVNSIRVMIMVVDRKKGTFQVKCISSGGRALNMSITGPEKHKHKLSSIEAVGDPQGIGNDMFSVSSINILSGQDGAVYQCTASNGVSPDPTNSTELKGSCLLFRDRIRYYFTFHSCLCP